MRWSQERPPMLWAVLFPHSPYDARDRKAILVDILLTFFSRTDAGRALLSGCRWEGGRPVLQVDYQHMEDELGSEDFILAMRWQPVEAIQCIAVAAHEVLFSDEFAEQRGSTLAPPGPAGSRSRLAVRLSNHRASETHIRSLRAALVNQLVTVRGTVVKAGPLQPQVFGMEFSCAKCQSTQWMRFPDFQYMTPTKCRGDGCRSRTFTAVRETAACVDWQRLKVQEIVAGAPGSDGAEDTGGRVPRSLEVEVSDDLAGLCCAGDHVEISGILKVHRDVTAAKTATGPPNGGKGQQQQAGLFTFYLEAVGIKVVGRTGQQEVSQVGESRAKSAAVAGDVADWIPGVPAFSLPELEFIWTYKEECRGQYLKQLVRAFCPQIYGNAVVKAGILLALFGGSRKQLSSGAPGSGSAGDADDAVPLRGNVHVLLVGDPGLGKSQMLKAACEVSPRSLYVCGNSSTSAGLTVSVAKEAGRGGEFTFEAGTVVLGDQGVVCVDEFDKMQSDHAALLEVMEQQEVSVAKAGLVATLPGRTTVLAAANPAKGHYDRGKTVAQNLKMSPAMLSRFDLIFVMEDRPDGAMDARLSEHVMAVHSGDRARIAAARADLAGVPLLPPGGEGDSQAGPGLGASQRWRRPGEGDGRDGRAGPSGQHVGQPRVPVRVPLEERLRLSPNEAAIDPLPASLLRRLIAYARIYVRPVLSDDACRVLQDFWLELRQSRATSDGIPVTMRQLDGLVRLAEARARMELAEVVTAEHAADVVDVVRSSAISGAAEASPDAPARKRRCGSKAAEMQRLLEGLAAQGRRFGKDVFDVSEIYEVSERLQIQGDLQSMISILNDAGELLKRGPSCYTCPSVRT